MANTSLQETELELQQSLLLILLKSLENSIPQKPISRMSGLRISNGHHQLKYLPLELMEVISISKLVKSRMVKSPSNCQQTELVLQVHLLILIGTKMVKLLQLTHKPMSYNSLILHQVRE